MIPCRQTIFYVDALAGAGKTYSAIRYAHRLARRGQKVIVAQPSRHLIEMTVKNELQGLSPVRYTVLHGDRVKPVTPAIVAHFKETASGGEILFVTHEGLLRTPFIQNKGNWVLLWDEFPQIDHSVELNLPDTGKLIAPLIEVEPDDALYSIATPAGCEGEAGLEAMAQNANDDDVLRLFQNFARRMISDHFETYLISSQWMNLVSGEGEVRRLSSFALLQPSFFKGFKQVVLLGACFEETLLNLLWSAQGVRFKPFKLPLRYTRHQNGDLLRILYVTDEPWSKSIRDRKTGDQSGSVLDLALDRCRTRLGDAPFIWMGNKDLSDGVFGVPNAIRLPNSPHGLNEFQHVHNVVVLSALNPSPGHFAFLESRGVDGEAVRTAGYRQAVYQAVMRSSLRDPDDRTAKTVVVMDRDTADWLAAKFSGSTVAVLGDTPLGPVRKKPGRSRIHATSAERKAAHRREQEIRLLIEQDIITGDDLVASDYAALATQVRASMTEVAGFPEQILGIASETAGTVFASLYSTRPTDHVTHEDDDAFIASLKSLHGDRFENKEDAGLISPAHFEPEMASETSRGLANIRHVRGVWLDNDGGDLSPDEFARLLPFLRIAAWNTFSSTPELPRWRAFIPTTQAMSLRVHRLILDQILKVLNKAGYWSKEQLAKNLRIRNRRLHGFDTSKLNPASMFFLPCQAAHPKGSFFTDYGEADRRRMPIEPYVWIKKSIIHTNPAPPPKPMAPTTKIPICGGGSPTLQRIRAALLEAETRQQKDRLTEEAVNRWRAEAQCAGQGNREFFVLGSALKRAGHDDFTIRSILEAEAGFARHPKERRQEIPTIMRSLARRRP